MENIFEGTPFKSYEDMVQAVNGGTARFSCWRAAAYDVASGISKMSFFTYYLGFLLSVLTLMAFSIYTRNYWTLFFIPVLFVLFATINRLTSIVVLCAIGSVIAIWLHTPLWILSLLISIVILYVGYHIWWAITTTIVNKELVQNEQLFISMWQGHVLAIRDNEGNLFTSKIDF